MQKAGVSQRELARRLADTDGTKPESKRRWIGKLLDPEGVENPSPGSVAAIERALALKSGYFKLSVPERMSRTDRLRSLEEVVQHQTAAATALVLVVEQLLEQVVALGGNVREETVQELAQAAVHMRSGVPRQR